ncbi:MAG TPA: FAD-dependent oxidoreductase [Verrucomicrobiae bacterium]|nr:FAD-dependent oxidoreductase [Verrucomicrobiae bacterium]
MGGTKVAIIGAGVTGLTVARKLVEAGCEVVVHEAGPIGGLAAGFEFPGIPGTYLEKFYHHVFRSDRLVVRLIEEFGLGPDLVWRQSRTGVFGRGRLWSLEGPLDLLRCQPVGNVLDRLKMGLSLRVFQQTEDWEPLDAITCEEFFRARGCLAGYRGLWEPLLKAKFGEAYRDIPAAFLWGRIYPRSRSREKGKESLGYLLGGFPRMTIAMAKAVEQRGARVEVGSRVTRIERLGPGRFRVRATAGEETFDRIVWTGQPSELGRLLEPAEPSLDEKAGPIRYIAACCLVLLLNRRLGDYYWINNLDPEITFGGVIEHTNLVGTGIYGGLHVAYVINYLNPQHPQMKLDVEEVFRLHLPSLRKLYADFDPSIVERKFLFKSPAASPVYDRGYLKRLPPFVGWSDGIGLLGMPQVYPMDRNMNHCIHVAEEAEIDQLLK